MSQAERRPGPAGGPHPAGGGVGAAARARRAAPDLLLGPPRSDSLVAGLELRRARWPAAQVLRGRSARRERRRTPGCPARAARADARSALPVPDRRLPRCPLRSPALPSRPRSRSGWGLQPRSLSAWWSVRWRWPPPIAGRSCEDSRMPGSPTRICLGMAQATALAPGVSRHGAALAAGRLRCFTRADAEHFAGLVAAPADRAEPSAAHPSPPRRVWPPGSWPRRRRCICLHPRI